MAGNFFAFVGIALIVFVFFAMSFVSASYISHVPIKTIFGTQVDIFYVEGRFPGLECVAVSGDGFRDAMLGINGIDPYFNSVSLGFVKPYDLFCGYNGKMIGVGNSSGVCYFNGN